MVLKKAGFWYGNENLNVIFVQKWECGLIIEIGLFVFIYKLLLSFVRNINDSGCVGYVG